ncbi:MAG TPA: hypothetical protein VIE89_05720 [Candidatus Binatia bacterium]
MKPAVKKGKVVISVPASAEFRKGVEKIVKQRFGIEAELIAGIDSLRPKWTSKLWTPDQIAI